MGVAGPVSLFTEAGGWGLGVGWSFDLSRVLGMLYRFLTVAALIDGVLGAASL